MRKVIWTRCSGVLLGLALLACSQAAGLADDEKAEKRVTVKKIIQVDTAIEKSLPANLVVTAIGQVPTGGYKDAKLTRVKYKKPPKDGIQEYDLTAVPPSGIALQVLSKVKASDTWKAYKKEAPWIKGIRINGMGDGVKVEKFD